MSVVPTEILYRLADAAPADDRPGMRLIFQPLDAPTSGPLERVVSEETFGRLEVGAVYTPTQIADLDEP